MSSWEQIQQLSKENLCHKHKAIKKPQKTPKPKSVIACLISFQGLRGPFTQITFLLNNFWNSFQEGSLHRKTFKVTTVHILYDGGAIIHRYGWSTWTGIDLGGHVKKEVLTSASKSSYCPTSVPLPSLLPPLSAEGVVGGGGSDPELD